MNDNNTPADASAAVPPIPGHVYRSLADIRARMGELRGEMREVLRTYEQMNPAQVTTDHLGKPITTEQALDQVRHEIGSADIALRQSRAHLNQALEPASRLMSTAQTANRREAEHPEHDPAPRRHRPRTR